MAESVDRIRSVFERIWPTNASLDSQFKPQISPGLVNTSTTSNNLARRLHMASYLVPGLRKEQVLPRVQPQYGSLEAMQFLQRHNQSLSLNGGLHSGSVQRWTVWEERAACDISRLNVVF